MPPRIVQSCPVNPSSFAGKGPSQHPPPITPPWITPFIQTLQLVQMDRDMGNNLFSSHQSFAIVSTHSIPSKIFDNAAQQGCEPRYSTALFKRFGRELPCLAADSLTDVEIRYLPIAVASTQLASARRYDPVWLHVKLFVTFWLRIFFHRKGGHSFVMNILEVTLLHEIVSNIHQEAA